MSIRSVDFQTIIPKTPEVQRIKHAETENEKINAQINIHKDAEIHNKSLKQVNKSDKPHEARINKDDKKQKSQGNKDNKNDEHSGKQNNKSNDEKNKNNNIELVSKIDIRI